MDRGVGQLIVPGVTNSRTQLSVHVDWLLAPTCLFPRKSGWFCVSLSSMAEHPGPPQVQILTRSEQVGNDTDSGSLRECMWRVGMCGHLDLCVPRLGLCSQRGYCAHSSQEDPVTSGFTLALMLCSWWLMLLGGLGACVGEAVETLILFGYVGPFHVSLTTCQVEPAST